jgi:hypothetical protein
VLEHRRGGAWPSDPGSQPKLLPAASSHDEADAISSRAVHPSRTKSCSAPCEEARMSRLAHSVCIYLVTPTTSDRLLPSSDGAQPATRQSGTFSAYIASTGRHDPAPTVPASSARHGYRRVARGWFPSYRANGGRWQLLVVSDGASAASGTP